MIRDPYREIEQAIGYRFRKKKVLELALTHPSFRYENPETADDNQRLEYLGDAVLSLISAEYLYINNPLADEGVMSQLRSRLTQDRKLAELGTSIHIGKHLRLGHGERINGGAERSSNLADAMEAIIGAAWVDGGARAVHRIFKHIFLPELENFEADEVQSNPKGELQEFAQSHGYEIPTYETIASDGPEHDRTFTIELKACNKQWVASAGSKREAERLAAAQALESLQGSKG